VVHAERGELVAWRPAIIRGSQGFPSESLHQGLINPAVVFGKARLRKTTSGKTTWRWHALRVRKAATAWQDRQPEGCRADAHLSDDVSNACSWGPGTRVLGWGRGHKATRDRRLRPTANEVATPVEVRVEVDVEEVAATALIDRDVRVLYHYI